MVIRELQLDEKKYINDVVSIHLRTFSGFFLTFMGRGFLKQMYVSYCEHRDSGLLVAIDNKKIVGFLAYSSNFSGLYKFMLRRHILQFAWFSLGAFLRRPSSFVHIVSAFLKPSETKRSENYVELASIGVDPDMKSKGIGTELIDRLKETIDFKFCKYITLETDALNNNIAINFYKKNGFVCKREYITNEGRRMLEFRYNQA